MSFVALVGTGGAVLILIAFVLSSLERLSRGSYVYMFINGLGAFLLIYYSIESGVVVFVALNSVWLGVEFYHLIKKLIKARSRK
jgi:hypothetical protein